jgi:hypothetical protein
MRKMKTKKEHFSDIMKGDFLDDVYRIGLLRCRDCQIDGTPPQPLDGGFASVAKFDRCKDVSWQHLGSARGF